MKSIRTLTAVIAIASLCGVSFAQTNYVEIATDLIAKQGDMVKLSQITPIVDKVVRYDSTLTQDDKTEILKNLDTVFESCNTLVNEDKSLNFVLMEDSRLPKTQIRAIDECKDLLAKNYTLGSINMFKRILKENSNIKNIREFATADEFVNVTIQTGFRSENIGFKKTILDYCVRFAKKTVRKNGYTFVGKEGAKRVQAFIDAIAADLNAPGLGKLDESLNAIGIALDFDFIKDEIMKYDDAKNLAAQIIAGDIDITSSYRFKLQIALGVKDFNEFVKAYNGEESK